MGTQMYVLESKDDQQWQGCKWIAPEAGIFFIMYI